VGYRDSPKSWLGPYVSELVLSSPCYRGNRKDGKRTNETNERQETARAQQICHGAIDSPPRESNDQILHA
jgi:hypothetical protein